LRRRGNNVREDLETKVLLAKAKSSCVGLPCGKRSLPDVASNQNIVHPFSSRNIRHNSSGVGEAVVLSNLEFFLTFADLFSV
jgi:hypothetical protein